MAHLPRLYFNILHVACNINSMCTFKMSNNRLLHSGVRFGWGSRQSTGSTKRNICSSAVGHLFRSHIAILVLLQMADSFAPLTLLQQWSAVMHQLHNAQSCMIPSSVLFSILSMTTILRRIFVNLLP